MNRTMTILFAPALVELALMMVGITVAVWYGRLERLQQPKQQPEEPEGGPQQ